MYFEINSHPSVGIKLIGDIADYQLCRLEGRNGIGKSLVAKLLDLATGGRPFGKTSETWASLQHNLGVVSITVTGLQDGGRLEIQLDPATWQTVPDGGTSDLGTARLNGEPIPYSAVRDTLRVVRIAGDEDIVTQFRAVIELDVELVKHYNTIVSHRIDTLGEVCDRLLRDLAGVSPSRLKELEATKTRCEAVEKETLHDLDQLQNRVDQLQALQNRMTLLSLLQDESPAIASQLESIESTLAELTIREQTLTEKQRALLPDAERERRMADELGRLRRERRRQDTSTRELKAKAHALFDRLQTDADARSARDAEAASRADRDTLLRQRAAILAPPDLPAFIQRLRQIAESPLAVSLDDEIVATLDNLQVSAAALRTGLERRHTELTNDQHTALLGEIDRRISAADSRIKDLRAAVRLLQEIGRAERRLAEIESSTEQLTDQLNHGRDAAYSAVVQELDQVQKSILDAVGKRAELRYRMGVLEREGSIDTLTSEIAVARTELGLESSSEAALNSARSELEAFRARAHEAADSYRRAAVEHSEFVKHVDEIVALLERSPDYAWLRQNHMSAIPSSHYDKHASVDKIAALDCTVRQLQDHLNLLVNDTARVLDAIHDLSRHSESADTSLNACLAPLASHYEAQFGSLLREPEIESALFENGRFSHLDLLTWEAVWENAEGEPQRRPISAFSSGERAFAYVFASILRYSNEPARNRVLILDEFGAFLEADRLSRLMHFLNDRVLRPNLFHQAIVVLPLRDSITDLYSQGRDEDALSVESTGYFMKAISMESLHG